MSVNMFVGASQSQAASVLAKSQQDQQAYENMLQALQQFIGEDRLNSAAYRNAKGFYSAVLMPLTKAGILLSEAVGEACQKFVQAYQGTVDSGDLKSEELEEKIQQLNGQISHLDSIRATIEGKELADNFKIRQLNQNSQAKGLLEDARDMLQKKLDKLLDFHGTSPAIFSAISELEAMVSQGAAQAGTSFTGSGFSIPTDLGWTATIAEKWQTRAENIKKKEKEYHEKKIKELEKHNVYAWPYEDPDTKEIKIMWFIDKDGVRVFDKELQEYVERYGKNLEGIYEVVDWEKIYELDLAARRRGDGRNYLNSNQLPKGWEWSGQANAHIESAYWMANKTGLLDLALMAGLVYLNKKTKVSTSKNVANVLDDAADTKHASGSNDVLSGSKNGKNYTLDKSKSTGNVAYKKVSQPNNFTIGPDAKDHLVNSQGLVRKKGKGVIGGHNMDAFYGELRAQGFNVDDCIINKKPHPTVEGIYEIEYRVPKEVKGKLVLDEYKKIPEPKTVYDPNVFSNDQIYQWGSEAMQSGTINGRIVKGSSNDIGFTGYLDAVTGELTNFHPSMKR